MLSHPARWMIAAAAAAVLIGGAAGPAPAHERRTVGSINMTVGWGDEPTYAGLKNSVQVILTGKAGKPIVDLTDTLKVEVRFGSQTTGPLDIERAFGRAFGRPGDYRAQIIPTRPGTYSFHFTGTVDNQKIDQTFTSSDKTFDNVQDAGAIEFPVKDPSTADLSGRLERESPRVDEAHAAAARATTVGTIGLVAGIAGIAVGLGAMRRRRPG
ncbi:MAG TPA: hypothetical protein VJT33_07645 [bacterium]|nr:hypothetical protein [bacterium]